MKSPERRGRPILLSSPWRELAEAAGGVGELAAALGVTSRTVQRWAEGTAVPNALSRRAIDAWAVASKCVPPFGGGSQ